MRLVALAVLVLAGCITPSIPIPPPEPGKMTFEVTVDEGTGESSAVFTYGPDHNYAGSLVFLFNRDRGTGVIDTARDDGSVGPTAPLAASLGEQIVVTFDREDQTVSTCIRLRDGTQSSTDFCGP